MGNFLPFEQLLDLSKLMFTGKQLNVGEVIIAFFGGVENSVGKGENDGFKGLLPSGLLKVGILQSRKC